MLLFIFYMCFFILLKCEVSKIFTNAVAKYMIIAYNGIKNGF